MPPVKLETTLAIVMLACSDSGHFSTQGLFSLFLSEKNVKIFLDKYGFVDIQVIAPIGVLWKCSNICWDRS